MGQTPKAWIGSVYQAKRKRGCIEIVGQYLLTNSGTISAANWDIGVQFLVAEAQQANHLTFCS